MGDDSLPDISIVIPSFNQASFLPATLDSVLSQNDVSSLQVIIVDGGSTDGTLEILRSINDPRVTWTSEPDNGQSHAINKGMRQADGRIVTWLNSDDLYCGGALRRVVDTFDANPKAKWLVGRVGMIDRDGNETRRAITRYKDRRLRRYGYRRLLRENFISQMGVFWRRSFWEAVGPLDESLMYTMDYDLWLRMGGQIDPMILDAVLSQFRLHGQSKSGAVNRAQFDEQYAVASRYFDGDSTSRVIHRLNVEKIVWSYRLLRLFGC